MASTTEEHVRADSCVHCGRPLPPYTGSGRPTRYCPEPHEPGGKTCRQLAAEARAAQRAAGMDEPLVAFRDEARAFGPVAESVLEQVSALLAAVQSVEGGALARIADAEREMRVALDRAAAADAERDRAVRGQQAADTERARAVVERDEARQSERATRVEAEKAVAAAAAKVAEAERRRGQAESAAEERKVAAQTEVGRRKAAEDRAAEAQRHAYDLAEQLRAVQEELVERERERSELAAHVQRVDGELAWARADSDRLHAELLAERDVAAGLREQLEDERRRSGAAVAGAERRAVSAEAVVEHMHAQIDDLRDQIVVAKGERDQARADAATTRTRVDLLTDQLAALANVRSGPSTPSPDAKSGH